MANKRQNDMYQEIFKEFIALKDKDLKKSQEVFKSVFDQVKKKLEEQCNFFAKYATQVLYAGSVYDGIKVSKLDEFDMNIVIRLPINYDDSEDGIILENDLPGFVKLRIGRAFDNLDKQKEWESCHKITRDWRDNDKYLLQNKFRSWLHSLIQTALNSMKHEVTVNDVKYILSYKSSGPAYTLNIKSVPTDEPFNLDVDLVPVIRFMLPRWPKGYKNINNDKAKEWFVVPKPNKNIETSNLQNKCWRLSFQEQEKYIMRDLKQLKITIRLVKKLRDARGMKHIASYYIKTLFLWKIQRTNHKKYWESNVSTIFKDMIEEFYDAVNKKNIPYFWHEKNNLIGGVKETVLRVYADKLKEVLDSINKNDVEKLSSYLLTKEEFDIFKNSEFFKKYQTAAVHRQMSMESTSSYQSSQSRDVPDSSQSSNTDVIKDLMDKISVLTKRVNSQEERIKALEMNKQKLSVNAAYNGFIPEKNSEVSDLLTF
ncbi:unnamed protein product [Leptosia nina]|uniref:Cyclic GMP-AMP synthase-like n=1 Tax=Leptosia nina TaxID=320188 RepID=A0AAV1JV89_9NEOP